MDLAYPHPPKAL